MIFFIKNGLVCYSTMVMRPNNTPITYDLPSLASKRGVLIPLGYASLNLLDDPTAKTATPDAAVFIKSDGRVYERVCAAFSGGRRVSQLYRVPIGKNCDYCRAASTTIEDRIMAQLSIKDEVVPDDLLNVVYEATFDLTAQVVIREHLHVMPFDELVKQVQELTLKM